LSLVSFLELCNVRHNVPQSPYDFLLEVALEGNVDYLVTGDEDLLVLNPFHNIKIIKPKEFGKVLRKNPN